MLSPPSIVQIPLGSVKKIAGHVYWWKPLLIILVEATFPHKLFLRFLLSQTGGSGHQLFFAKTLAKLTHKKKSG
jgi:hypothetical protein